MSTHTPAPWKIAADKTNIIAEEDAPVYFAIASVINWHTDDETTSANARLIAAAPDLLATLKNAVTRMEENHPPKAKRGDLNATFKNAKFYRDLEAARAAILKAEG